MKKWNLPTLAGFFLLLALFGLGISIASAQEDAREEPLHEEQKAPSVEKKELNDFTREMKDLVKESKKLLSDLKKVKDSESWQQTIQEIIKNASACASQVLTIPAEDRRSHIDDCRSERYWDQMNEIRDEFVPPQEIKNAMNDIKRQLKDLANLKKQLLKSNAAADVSKIDQFVSQINGHKSSIESAKGRDQRDALQDFWGGNYWEEINKIRFQVELPKEIKNIAKEIQFAEKDSKARNTLKGFSFFGLDSELLAKIVQEKKESIAQMQSLMEKGEFEAAGEMMQETIHEGWHPGDLRHFLGMMREAYERMKNVKDDQILDQILVIMDPIASSFADGDVRGARDAMVEFTEQMKKYESLFKPYYRGSTKGLDKKARGALDKLEDLIQEKLKKGELKKPIEEGEDGSEEGNGDPTTKPIE